MESITSGKGRGERCLKIVTVLINVFYYAMDASDFGGIIDDFNDYSSACLVNAGCMVWGVKGVSAENGKK